MYLNPSIQNIIINYAYSKLPFEDELLSSTKEININLDEIKNYLSEQKDYIRIGKTIIHRCLIPSCKNHWMFRPTIPHLGKNLTFNEFNVDIMSLIYEREFKTTKKDLEHKRKTINLIIERHKNIDESFPRSTLKVI